MRRGIVALVLAFTLIGTPPGAANGGPSLETPLAELEAALECHGGFDDPIHEPVLLVHGTFTNAWEHWSWNWEPALAAGGWDVCTVNLPNRSLGDMQVQAEYVVYAIRTLEALSGGKVDVIGHSQGAVHPRWAVKWWPDVASVIDDLVMLAGPQHGTSLGFAASGAGCFASCWQMLPNSQYLNALNRDDETPGDLSYTSIYTATDELVQPQVPESTSALDGGTNILVQDVCPGRPVEHAFLMADRAVHDLVMDALTHPGPTEVERIDPLHACAGLWFDGVNPATHAADITQRDVASGFPKFEDADAEPPLKDYARGTTQETPRSTDGVVAGASASGSMPEDLHPATGPTPATGASPPLLIALALVGLGTIAGHPNRSRARRERSLARAGGSARAPRPIRAGSRASADARQRPRQPSGESDGQTTGRAAALSSVGAGSGARATAWCHTSSHNGIRGGGSFHTYRWTAAAASSPASSGASTQSDVARSNEIGYGFDPQAP